MASNYTELLAAIRRDTREVSLEELRRRMLSNASCTLIDVRDAEEYRGGFIPGAVSIPRGFLELRVEDCVPDKSTNVVTYCAGGTRSALAARTLAELGYTNVETANPGFERWRELGYPIETPTRFSDAQRTRYTRHLRLPEVGEAGQETLLKSRVLLIGVGGLGSPVALYLAAAGVGTLGLVDADVVDASNLQRQVIHATSRIGHPKVESAEIALRDLNPDVTVIAHDERLTHANVARLIAGYDLVVDGSDNFPTRYLVNDACVALGKPLVHGSIFRFEGQVTTILSGSAAVTRGLEAGPCYRCLYPEPPPASLSANCQDVGVLGVLPGAIGVLQATEALKILLGQGKLLVGRLLTYDSLDMTFREFRLARSGSCSACGPAHGMERPNPTAKPIE